VVKLGIEYRTSRLPPRTYNTLGHEMVTEVENARRAPLTGYVNTDDDLIAAQSWRVGPAWCVPEDWGTWSKYPVVEKQFFVTEDQAASPCLHIYEKLRVTPPLLGQQLTIRLNGRCLRSLLIEELEFVLRVLVRSPPLVGRFRKIRLEYAFEKSTLEVISKLREIDGRILGLGFESMFIFGDADFGWRLTMMEMQTYGEMDASVIYGRFRIR
jgi:hypothetical protein